MLVSHDTEYRGRKQKVGSPIFTATGRLNFFIGYCPDCRGKCTVTNDEAKKLMRMFSKNQSSPIQRIIRRVLIKYAPEY